MLRKVLIGFALLITLLGGAAFALKPADITDESVRSSVVRTPALMERAWALPAAAAYGRKLEAQTNGSVCGPSSLANTFRSLGAGPTSEDAVLDGTGLCWTGMCFIGLTLDELAGLARAKTSRKVTLLRDLTPDAFREHLRKSNDAGVRYVVNFSRKPIFGAGGGHHSPIGGYLQPEDLVFVLDVNRRFGPWLVPRERLFAAMDTLDGERKRGMLRIE
jgi:hypothetical protein